MSSVKDVLHKARDYFAHHEAARDFIKTEWEILMDKMQELMSALEKVEPILHAEKTRADTADAKVKELQAQVDKNETDAGSALDKLNGMLSSSGAASSSSSSKPTDPVVTTVGSATITVLPAAATSPATDPTTGASTALGTTTHVDASNGVTTTVDHATGTPSAADSAGTVTTPASTAVNAAMDASAAAGVKVPAAI